MLRLELMSASINGNNQLSVQPEVAALVPCSTAGRLHACQSLAVAQVFVLVHTLEQASAIAVNVPLAHFFP